MGNRNVTKLAYCSRVLDNINGRAEYYIKTKKRSRISTKRRKHSNTFILYTFMKELECLSELTEFEVCTGKYLPVVFVQTERRRNKVCAEKAESKHFPAQTGKTRLIRNLLFGFWFLLSSLLTNFLVCELAA